MHIIKRFQVPNIRQYLKNIICTTPQLDVFILLCTHTFKIQLTTMIKHYEQYVSISPLGKPHLPQ